jgi:hypothetical protein
MRKANRWCSRAGQPDAGAHGAGDCASSFDDSPRQSHSGARRGSHYRLGSHEELLVSSPTYQRLYQLQFRDMPEAQSIMPVVDERPEFSPALITGAE